MTTSLAPYFLEFTASRDEYRIQLGTHYATIYRKVVDGKMNGGFIMAAMGLQDLAYHWVKTEFNTSSDPVVIRSSEAKQVAKAALLALYQHGDRRCLKARRWAVQDLCYAYTGAANVEQALKLKAKILSRKGK